MDKEYKTVYVRPGRTAEIEWVNEAITGQIQIYKYAAEANSVTGVPAGTPLQGAVYEIINERSGPGGGLYHYRCPGCCGLQTPAFDTL